MSEIEQEAEKLAQQFHEAYERLAPSFGYVTRPDTRAAWAQVPEQNRRLMIAVCAEIQGALLARLREVQEHLDIARRDLEWWKAERDQLRQQLAEKEQALVDLRDYFAYGQGEHKGMMAVTTPRCSPSVWKEINRRVDEALALAAPKE